MKSFLTTDDFAAAPTWLPPPNERTSRTSDRTDPSASTIFLKDRTSDRSEPAGRTQADNIISHKRKGHHHDCLKEPTDSTTKPSL
ncbi:hypothetical protein XA68_13319 [Ophiocordyceps unilateralis]|uniref:Uncharacterized protein n=1 Tax=Ophiocordyceps unilateralis TaxID=268505 RepID=A0A2A9PCT6_OPHUN|nr:hypothetical protein XA68_13319 [Ophiocordyceps unilateralis]